MRRYLKKNKVLTLACSQRRKIRRKNKYYFYARVRRRFSFRGKGALATFISLLSLASVIVIGYFQVSVMSRQTDIMEGQASVDKIQVGISMAQMKIARSQEKTAEIVAKLADSSSRPVISYKRIPESNIVIAEAPLKSHYSYKYPDDSKFVVSAGVGSILEVKSFYRGYIFYSKECPFRQGAQSRAIYVGFADSVVASGGYSITSSRVDRSLEKNEKGGFSIVSNGIVSRIAEMEEEISSKVSGCFGDSRIYAYSDVEFVDAFSEVGHVYFDGFLMTDLDVTSREKNEKERIRPYVCMVGGGENWANLCAKALEKTLSN